MPTNPEPDLTPLERELLEALTVLYAHGCPACIGDCGSENPPVTDCPMQLAGRAIARASRAGGEG